MKRKIWFLLIILLLVLETFFEIKVRKNNIINTVRNENLLINFGLLKAFEKDLSLLKKIGALFFKRYNSLHYIAVATRRKIFFYGSKDNKYKKIFTVALSSTIRDSVNKKFIIYKLNRTQNMLIFNNSVGDIKFITGFVISYNFVNIIYFRNVIIASIIIFLYLILKKREKDYVSTDKIDISSQERVNNQEITGYKALYEDNQKLIEEVENLTTFREVGLAINSILDFNQMLHVIMGVVMGKMNVKKIIIYLINEEEQELRGKIGREGNRIITEEELEYERIIIGIGPIGRAMEYHSPIITAEADGANILVCPLIAKGNLIGAIKIEEKIDGELFTERDKEFMQLLSAQIAIALNNARLYEMAITDGLTKLYVHRHLQYKLHDEILRSRRSGKPVSLIMLDIDHFKTFNDTYGHQTGDYVLAEIAHIIKKMFRATDGTFRYGGEEMAVLLPETDGEDAYVLAEKLRENIMHHKFNFNGEVLSVTVSLGVATYYPQTMGKLTKEQLIKMADEALYFSKRSGRNRTTLFSNNIIAQNNDTDKEGSTVQSFTEKEEREIIL